MFPSPTIREIEFLLLQHPVRRRRRQPTTAANDSEREGGGGVLVTTLQFQGVRTWLGRKIAPRSSLFMTTRFNEDRWSGVEWSG